jgi:peptidoglycan/LPS O-acetylase OafA/YrhL
VEGQRIKALDGIRGIAAMIIAFGWHYHTFSSDGFSPDTYPFSRILYWPYHFGYVAVDIFFILSGFIFFTLYRNKIAEHSLSFRDFAVLRFSRLYPLHWLTLIIVLMVQVFIDINGLPVDYTGSHWKFFFFLINVPMLQNGWFTTYYSFNAPSWSISIEIMMYLLFFLVFCNTRETKKYLLYCLFLIYLGAVIKLSGDDKAFFNEQVARGLMGFFIGCLTGEIYEYCKTNKKQGLIFTCFCGFAVSVLIIVPALYGYGILKKWELVYTFAFYPALIFVILRIKYISALFSIKPLVHLGNLSYGIYLLHYPLQLIIKTSYAYLKIDINYSSKIFYISYCAAVLVISHFIYRYFEKPIQNKIRIKFMRVDC